MKMRQLVMLAAVIGLAVISLAGCKKKEPTAPTAPTMENMTDTAMQAADSNEQTICPVMGGKINKDIYTEYKGKKVYFCCSDCKAAFAKEPEKYLDKLPQFKN